MDLSKAMTISARGMAVQGSRLRVVAENIANADTTGSTPGADAYRRKIITFENTMDHTLGAQTVVVKSIKPDPGEFPLRFDPENPAANPAGYVKTANVNTFVEVMDMREAERSYSANLNVMEATRSMLSRTIDMLK